MTTTYGGKQVIDPRIFVNHTGGVEYPADYNLPTHTGGHQTVTNDKDSQMLMVIMFPMVGKFLIEEEIGLVLMTRI